MACATTPPRRRCRRATTTRLVRAALDYARAVRSGRLAEADFEEDWGLRPAAYDPLPAFARRGARRTGSTAGRAVCRRPIRAMTGFSAGWPTIARSKRRAAGRSWRAGPDIAPGAKGPARPRAARSVWRSRTRRSSALGDSFDGELKAAVRRAQTRYGLNPTGTRRARRRCAALNVSAADRVAQIMANMERWRWLPKELDKNRIQVNIAAALVTVFEGDQPIMSMRGVTGRPGDETPMLQSSIHSVVINPPWNVPTGIAAARAVAEGRRVI